MVLEVTRLRSLEVMLRRLVLDVLNGEWRDIHVAHEAVLRTVLVEVDNSSVIYHDCEWESKYALSL